MILSQRLDGGLKLGKALTPGISETMAGFSLAQFLFESSCKTYEIGYNMRKTRKITDV